MWSFDEQYIFDGRKRLEHTRKKEKIAKATASVVFDLTEKEPTNASRRRRRIERKFEEALTAIALSHSFPLSLPFYCCDFYSCPKANIKD